MTVRPRTSTSPVAQSLPAVSTTRTTAPAVDSSRTRSSPENVIVTLVGGASSRSPSAGLLSMSWS
ncbi:Uncharacterised protein [Mycobacterium tuberculosis]|nr:Uncharacterised protein [Mycobacterium tuberculosis]